MAAIGLPADEPRPERRGLLGLIGQLPGQISRLVRDELRAAQAELVAKLSEAGIGAGFVAGGALFALLALQVLIATGILGLATVLPAWLSALIVGIVLMIGAAIFILIGTRRLKKGVPPLPTEAIESVKADIRTVKGVNR